MPKLSSILLALCLLIMSCDEDVREAPANLIPEDQFVEVIIRMNLTEAVRSMNLTKEEEVDIPTEAFYNGIWEEFGISRERFESSFAYYRKDTEQMASIYKRASEVLKRMEDGVFEEQRQEADSIRNATPSDTLIVK